MGKETCERCGIGSVGKLVVGVDAGKLVLSIEYVVYSKDLGIMASYLSCL